MSGSESRWRLDAGAIRSRIPDVNDGILAVAGLAEGLSQISHNLSLASIVLMAAFAGAISIAGVRYTEEAAEREFQRDLIEEEQRLLELNPEEELEELVDHFMSKGVSAQTARAVAHELSAADALTAQLETEYGISDIISPTRPLIEAVGSGLCFLLGALIPVVLAFVVPGAWVEEYILLGVVISLAASAVVLSRLGHTRVLPTIGRSLLIGAATMGATVVIGTIVSGL